MKIKFNLFCLTLVQLVFNAAGTETETSTKSSNDAVPTATFAGGCFWGLENKFKLKFGNKTLISIQVGFTGGSTENPTYEDVCKGTTGHAESIQLKYDSNEASYEELVLFFWRIHDSTTLNRQGNDEGSEYRSAIFYHSAEQKEIAENVRQLIKPKFKDSIITEIVPATTFYPAEDYHQDYLEKNPDGYCNHRIYW